MRQSIISFGAGLVFSLGLAVSGMVDPSKIKGFLDFSGNWDPTMMAVMFAAVVTYFVAFRVVLGMPAPVLGLKFHVPTRNQLDWQLITGAVLFGTGWGITGLCPGPALVSLATGSLPVLAFVASMLGGMALFRVYEQYTLRRARRTSHATA